MDSEYYVYILQCSDSSFYTGITNNLEQRVTIHNDGKGAKYTRSRLPAKLVYSETFQTKSDALKRECQIKSWTRQKKAQLIAGLEDAE